MRPIVFLFPHDRMDVGGNSAQSRFMEACRVERPVQAASYGERIGGWVHLDDILTDPAVRSGCGGAPIFVIHWGPDIAMLLERLKGCDVVYFAHSTGWGMTMPPEVPILCVSRNTMAYWGRCAPNSYIAHVPNIVELPETSEMIHRDVDVLVQARKSSRYLLERLVPALREHCDVTLLDGWVEDLGAWFRRSKVYLYDSLEHWADVGATEGFGLPPLEAMGHGCTVFSSVNDALADYLDPGFNSHKLRVHSLAWDVDAIVRAVLAHDGSGMVCNGLEIYAPAQVTARLASVLQGVERFFAFTATTEPDIEDIWARRKPGTLQRAKRAVRLLAGV